MDEYIERGALLDKLKERDLCLCVTERDIKEAPAADVAPVVYANWKYYHKENIAVCTNCSFERDLDVNFGKAISCPNCGARMDKEAPHE